MPTDTISLARTRETARAGYTFMEAVLRDLASADDADDWVEVWRETPTLHEFTALQVFLGLTLDEYTNWVRDPDAIHEIVEARKLGS